MKALGGVWEYEEDTTLEIPYRFHRMSDAYQDAYDDALDAWNDSDTSVDFDFDNYQIHHNMGVRNDPEDTDLGKTQSLCLAGLYKRSWTYTWLNTAYLPNYSDTYKGAIATHELGHYIGVRHSTESPAIMRAPVPTSYGATVYEDDECAVNHRYENEDYPVTC